MDALTKIRKAQLTNTQKRFKDNFEQADGIGENGSRKLSSWGCYQRHTLPRDKMYLNDRENKQRNWELSNHAEFEERNIQLCLWKCFNKLGYKLLDNESAEELLERAKADGHTFDYD